ncbi:hypothetical protein, variant [Allomyces macrogynus ATCC 38327]|uniref:G-protein coupled receptors family 3 profile domain-containing protein n=1 Tax=Allomyces macrogynus (strain ATCC 38327) TaxID=578462 RepID=A0A0L0SJ09_ALLM3|nr:hypothetical protein, variant [Allomyces macrogynus ATCC 38327]|eukprot:KNE62370.1 hypothetical protein, variant [Allomyces macrogynus ATCC 38327]
MLCCAGRPVMDHGDVSMTPNPPSRSPQRPSRVPRSQQASRPISSNYFDRNVDRHVGVFPHEAMRSRQPIVQRNFCPTSRQQHLVMLRVAVAILLLIGLMLDPRAQAANFKIALVLPDTAADPTRRAVVQFVHFLLNWTLPILNQRLAAPAGHTFTLDYHDSLLTTRDTVRESLIAAQSGAVAVIGEWFSSNTIPMSYAMSHYGIFVCSGSATSEDLSDKTLHPTLFRSITSDSYQGNVFTRALIHFGWQEFNLLADISVYGTSVVKVIQADILTRNITIAAQYMMAFADPAEVTATVADLAKSPSRVVIMAMQMEQAYAIMAEAYAQGFDSSWVWIASEPSSRIAAKLDEMTSPAAMPDRVYALALRKFFEGMIVVWPQELALGDVTFNDWVQLYRATVGDTKILDFRYHLFSQSCLEAHMRAILNLDQKYGTNAVLQRTTNATLEEYLVPFNSSTGPVVYTARGDRMGYFQILNMQDSKLVPAMAIDSQFRISPLPGVTLHFPGNTTTVPPWQPRFQLDAAGYDQPGVMVTLAVAGISILAALGAWVMLVVYRRSKRVRHLGLPYISALCVGLAVALTTPFLWAGEPTDVTCNASEWTLILGMSLALASLAIRSYRLYRVFDNRVLAKSQSLGSRSLFRRCTPSQTWSTRPSRFGARPRPRPARSTSFCTARPWRSQYCSLSGSRTWPSRHAASTRPTARRAGYSTP